MISFDFVNDSVNDPTNHMNAAAMYAAAAAVGRTIPKIEPNEGGPRSSWMVPPPPRLQAPQAVAVVPTATQQQPTGPQQNAPQQPQQQQQQQHSAQQTQQHSLCKGYCLFIFHLYIYISL